jgi:site-specific DNA-cytosine methylase
MSRVQHPSLCLTAPNPFDPLSIFHVADAKVYNQCVNRILEHQADPESRRRPIYSIGDPKKPLPRFPKKGEVDLVSLTPPCTGFSGLNRCGFLTICTAPTTKQSFSFRKAADVRNTLIAPGLSLVELLRPKYVLSKLLSYVNRGHLLKGLHS